MWKKPGRLWAATTSPMVSKRIGQRSRQSANISTNKRSLPVSSFQKSFSSRFEAHHIRASNIPPGKSASLNLKVGAPDHIGPQCAFISDQLPEPLGGRADRLGADRLHLLDALRRVQIVSHRRMELAHD